MATKKLFTEGLSAMIPWLLVRQIFQKKKYKGRFPQGTASHTICAVLGLCKSKSKRCLQHSSCSLNFIFLYCLHFMPSESCNVKLSVWLMESRKLAQHDWANQPQPPLSALKASTNLCNTQHYRNGFPTRRAVGRIKQVKKHTHIKNGEVCTRANGASRK